MFSYSITIFLFLSKMKSCINIMQDVFNHIHIVVTDNYSWYLYHDISLTFSSSFKTSIYRHNCNNPFNIFAFKFTHLCYVHINFDNFCPHYLHCLFHCSIFTFCFMINFSKFEFIRNRISKCPHCIFPIYNNRKFWYTLCDTAALLDEFSPFMCHF